ncbi:hypothetical protein FSP39_000977 [Pinctada imbricata]|uniref:C2H2-type domain-containing protein n=1 Tax=Pinctada imbricata TaxID=66713 RepID=A0AA88XQZ6_PINIB|nr:hypothetical protein FSP39_000977 [Pinctada imbricata]
MTAYENKIIKGPTAKPPPKVQYIQVDPKKMIGPASYKAKMKKKIESNYPVAQNQDSNSLQRLVYNVGLDPNVVGVGSTDKLQQEINARTVAKRKADADKVTGKGMFKCNHCCIYFEDQAMSLLHKSLHNADDADPFTCRKCLKKLGNRLEFTAHLVWHLEPGMEG